MKLQQIIDGMTSLDMATRIEATEAAIALAPKGVKALMLLRELLPEIPDGANADTDALLAKARALLEGIEP